MRVCHACKKAFETHKELLWPTLARQNNLLVIVNISLFFLSGLVSQGYYYTFISLGFIGLASILMVLPLPGFNRFGYYLLCLGCQLAGIYFLLSSIFYWVQKGGKLVG